jgi:hypothetical protein
MRRRIRVRNKRKGPDDHLALSFFIGLVVVGFLAWSGDLPRREIPVGIPSYCSSIAAADCRG